MKIVLTALGVAAVLVASPAVANHIFTPTAFDTRVNANPRTRGSATTMPSGNSRCDPTCSRA
jgi:hypothetical protein